jgi:hypothetical protein
MNNLLIKFNLSYLLLDKKSNKDSLINNINNSSDIKMISLKHNKNSYKSDNQEINNSLKIKSWKKNHKNNKYYTQK